MPILESTGHTSVSSAETGLSRLVVAVFNAWQAARIPFIVLRNYQDLPQATSNDIDVLVRPEDLARAEQTLVEAAAESGFRLHNRAEFVPVALYFSSAELAQAHFDLFVAVKWHSFVYVDAEAFFAAAREFTPDLQPNGGERPFSFLVPHPVHEAVSNLLAGLLYSGQVKPKYRTSIAAAFKAHPDEARALLRSIHGAGQADFLCDAAARQDWAALEQRVAALRLGLIFRRLAARPFRAPLSVLHDTRRLLRRFFRSPGVWVVLCGADGCGKSTVIPAIVETLAPTFSPEKGAHFHWKPPVFSGARAAARGPVTVPHGRPTRNRLVSLLFLWAHWLEFFLGCWVRVRPLRFRGGLVLIDRWYVDFLVDQRRYRLRVPLGLVALGLKLLPKPDLVVLLDAPPAVLQSRKRELEPSETQRQCEAYRDAVRSLANGVLVDATRPPAQVAREISRRIIDLSAARLSGRRRPAPPVPSVLAAATWLGAAAGLV